ncbi:hypothetical protein DKX15_20370, partial [Enterococcus faecium]
GRRIRDLGRAIDDIGRVDVEAHVAVAFAVVEKPFQRGKNAGAGGNCVLVEQGRGSAQRQYELIAEVQGFVKVGLYRIGAGL